MQFFILTCEIFEFWTFGFAFDLLLGSNFRFSVFPSVSFFENSLSIFFLFFVVRYFLSLSLSPFAFDFLCSTSISISISIVIYQVEFFLLAFAFRFSNKKKHIYIFRFPLQRQVVDPRKTKDKDTPVFDRRGRRNDSLGGSSSKLQGTGWADVPRRCGE